jgi:flagellar hook-basal body complex protein FliE
MTTSIRSIGAGAPGLGAGAPGGAAPEAGATESFGQALGRLVQSVEASTSEANDAVAKMIDKSGEVHDAMIALQRADLTLQFAVQVRNKLVTAYQDIMRMPV